MVIRLDYILEPPGEECVVEFLKNTAARSQTQKFLYNWSNLQPRLQSF